MPERSVLAQSTPDPILGPEDPPAVAIHNRCARSPFLLVGDHAGNRVPAALSDLGLDDLQRRRHIAWDIGIAELGVCLADRLQSSFIHQRYSRLVIDCNRRPGAPDSVVEASDGTDIASNRGLSTEQIEARQQALFYPYQEAIREALDWRDNEGMETILVALHSFTPVMNGFARPWQVGVLHDRGDTRFAQAMIAAFAADPALTVGDNQPYSMDTIDYTIPHHAYPRRLPYAEIEIRQDLLDTATGIAEWCDRVEQALLAAARQLKEVK